MGYYFYHISIQFGTNIPSHFRQMVACRTCLDPIQIDDLLLKVKVSVTQYPFCHHNSLLTSLLWISVLLCPIKVKFDLSLRCALGRFVFEFDKIRMGDDVNHCDLI